MDTSFTHSYSSCSAANVSLSESHTYTTFPSFASFTNDALLTVFQADPLVYVDSDGAHPTTFLDFESERTLLADSLTDGAMQIDLKFDFATTERLGRFLARAEGRVLHLSCHGHPDFLAIENGWGAMHMLHVEKLRDWIQAGGGYLKFVFVSACFSRSAGEAFVEAGVRHVVCCQRDDQPILNVSSEIFARAFYQALANGRVLRQAFDLARQEVLNSPNLSRKLALEEAKKFALIPEENTDHNVPIFEHSPQSPTRPLYRKFSSSLPVESSDRVLPLPPQIFLDRQVDTWKILDALKSARVVRVTGAEGVGKASTVQKVCQYIQDRQGSCMRNIGEIVWLPTEDQHDELYNLSRIFCSQVYKCPPELRSHLNKNKVLLVVDARKAQSLQAFDNIKSFIYDVIHNTRGTRFIIINHIESDKNITQSLPCKERDFTLDSLDFVTTVRLFGKLCQHVTNTRCSEVSNPSELCALLIPQGSPTAKPRSRRGRDIFKMVGEGIPSRIHHAAKSMSCEEYKRMIALGLQEELEFNFESRADLEKDISMHKLQLEQARSEKRWGDALTHRHVLNEMELLREELLSLSTLQSLAKSLEADILQASATDDFWMCIELQKELDIIEEKIKIELSALENLGIHLNYAEEEQISLHGDKVKKYHNNGENDMPTDSLEKLEIKLNNALESNNFQQARMLDAQIKALENQISSLPVQEELESQVTTLQKALSEAMERRNIDLAEAVDINLQETLSLLAEAKATRNIDLIEKMDNQFQETLNISCMVNQSQATFSTEDTVASFDGFDAKKPVAVPIPGNPGPVVQNAKDAVMQHSASNERRAFLPSVPSVSLPIAVSIEAAHTHSSTDDSGKSSALVGATKPGAFAVPGYLVRTSNPGSREEPRQQASSIERREHVLPSPSWTVPTPTIISAHVDAVIHDELSTSGAETPHPTFAILPGGHSHLGGYDRYQLLHGVTEQLEQSIQESRAARGNRGRSRVRNGIRRMSRN